jgi:mono/diheme cytochrome c family protein
MTHHWHRLAGPSAALTFAFAFVLAFTAHAQSSAPGPQISAAVGGNVFRTYCAACHGTSARGDGPLADSMKRRPADLTEIALRNGGIFPTDAISRTIDGRQPVRGHGGPDMPVWGDAFKRAIEGGDEPAVRARIDSLVKYLDSIQVRMAQ